MQFSCTWAVARKLKGESALEHHFAITHGKELLYLRIFFVFGLVSNIFLHVLPFAHELIKSHMHLCYGKCTAMIICTVCAKQSRAGLAFLRVCASYTLCFFSRRTSFNLKLTITRPLVRTCILNGVKTSHAKSLTMFHFVLQIIKI